MEEHNRRTASFDAEKMTAEAKGNRAEYRLPEARKTVRARKRKKIIKAGVITAVLVFVAGWLMFDKLFVIRNFKMTGSEVYTSQQAEKAAEAIGIEKGSHIFGFNKKNAEENAHFMLSEFDSVSVSFDLPDTVVLNVKESVPVMYTVFGEKAYILSEALKVISAENDPSTCEDKGLAKIEFKEISKCVAGDFLVADGKSTELVQNLYAVLKEEGVAQFVSGIDVTNKFDISFDYGKRFRVELGDEKNLTVKIRYMKAIIEKLNPGDSGVIDVSDDDYRDATFKAYSKM